ncbi:MAG: hypothetical protein QXK06_03840 [Candidatus Diapherotrites archaeon]
MGIGEKIKEFVTGEKEDTSKAKKAKYPFETCALCNQPGCEKKWAGQYWHKKCMRQMRKTAKGMV